MDREEEKKTEIEKPTMKLTRRHFIVSAAAASAVGGVTAFIASGDPKPGLVWRGNALGGEARVSLYGTDEEAARSALAAVAKEVEQLEKIFSLHQGSSQLGQLNRDKRLVNPSRDLFELVASAVDWRSKTEGAFDPSVQPVYEAIEKGKPASQALIDAIGSKIEVRTGAISIEPDAALTLNGIAQGYIVDQVTKILINHGFIDVVVDAGELRIPGNTRRAVGIPAAKAAVSVAGVAIATSEPKTLVFDAKGQRHHLIDPHTGTCPRHWQSISVFAPTAEMADALSTAFSVLPHESVNDFTNLFGDIAVIGRDRKGRIRRFGDLQSLGGRPVT